MNEQLTFLPCPRWISPACGPRIDLLTPLVVWPEKQGLAHVLAASYVVHLDSRTSQTERRILRVILERLAIASKGLASDVRGELTLFVLHPMQSIEQMIKDRESSEERLAFIAHQSDQKFKELNPQWRVRDLPDVQQVELAADIGGERVHAWARVPKSWGSPTFYPL